MAMYKIDLQNGLIAYHGVPLKKQDIETCKATQELDGMIDVDAVIDMRKAALKIPMRSKSLFGYTTIYLLIISSLNMASQALLRF